MKVSINLASQPYENLRPLYSAVGMTAVLLITLAMLVIWNVRQNHDETRTLTAENAQMEQELGNLRLEQRELTHWLARPEVQEIRDRSAFLNSIIVRKSLSWTQMFMDLEKILPERVVLTGIRPGLDESQQARLNLTVAAVSVPPLVEFLKDLESSPGFGSPVVESQRFPMEKASDPNIVVDLSVVYHQAADTTSSPSQETKQEAARESAAAVAEPDQAQTPLRAPLLAPQQAQRLLETPKEER